MGFPYIRLSELSAAFAALPAADIGKPGPYIDPGLYTTPGPAYAPELSATTRMQQDAAAAAAQNAGNRSIMEVFTSSTALAKQMTADLMGTITNLWSDPDTGQVNFSNNQASGRAFRETVLAGQQFVSQLPGLFNTGYEAAPGAAPTVNGMAAGLGGSSGIGIGLILLLLVLAARGRK